MCNIKSILLLIVGSLLLSGCGIYGDYIYEHQVNLHLHANLQNLSKGGASIAMRVFAEGPFVDKKEFSTDQSGNALISFRTMTAGGLQRTPKPTYKVEIGKKTFYISPATPGATYSWRNGGWYTDASIDVK